MAHSFDEKVYNTAGIEFGMFYFVRKNSGTNGWPRGRLAPA
jgi:hypothetical protein